MPTYFEYYAGCAAVESDYIGVSPINDSTNLWIRITNSNTADCHINLTSADVQRLYDHLTVYLQEVKSEASGSGNQPK